MQLIENDNIMNAQNKEYEVYSSEAIKNLLDKLTDSYKDSKPKKDNTYSYNNIPKTFPGVIL